MKYEYDVKKNLLGEKRKEELFLANDTVCMLTAMLWASRSKDPSTQVGACFVNDRGRILSVGYNGAPNGWDDDDFTWKTDMEEEYNKYSYVVHGEMNAIFNYSGPLTDLRGSTVFVTLFPCKNCAKHLVQAGVKKVVYLNDTRKDKDNVCAKLIFSKCGVETEKFDELNLEGFNNIEMYVNSGSEKDMAKIKKLVPENKE